MTSAPQNHIEAAAAWFARLQETASVEDWQAFTAWLESDPAHRAAYNAVEAAWVEVEDFPDVWATPGTGAVAPARTVPARRPYWLGGAVAAAAAIVLAVALVWQPAGGGLADSFKTDATSTRVVKLGDGSELALNRSTEVGVRLQPDRRDVALIMGEVSFDVVSDPARPFHVAAGGHDIRVTGTEFNVLRDASRLVVTVRRGSVVVEDTATHAANVLAPGMQVVLVDGGPAATVERVDANDSFAWQHGNLVYKDTPLSSVAADLSRYFGKTVRVADTAAAIRVSGVLQIDEQAAMLRRLALFVPISVQFSGEEIVLYAR